ncbi:luciferin 4-monooxygenase-like [Drosophila kikkawai]|uniref:Luciferin 4-monooxygenase-like n=1 Tax=Drosophila kikkawai TaxID=30033 RepID=A0ABM4GCQ5_DROKI
MSPSLRCKLLTETIIPCKGIKRIRIVDDQGVSLGPNQIGEIYVHNGLRWKGYYGDEEESRRIQDPEGWFHTGDLGYFDDQNSLFVVDRIKDGLKCKNRTYWPSEIESVILELRQVQNVCVVGIFNAQVGYEAGALMARSSDDTISEQEIVDHVANRLPEEHKHLHAGVFFTEKLPINVNGKTVRRKARDLFMTLKAFHNGQV